MSELPTMQGEFDKYIGSVFNGIKISQIQYGELQKAFFAGVCVCYRRFRHISELPKNQAIFEVHMIHREILKFSKKQGSGGEDEEA